MKSSMMMLAAGALAVVMTTTGCATKRYAREQAGAVDTRVSEVDKKQTEALGSLETKMNQGVSRVEERAMTAENKANDAARAAQQAQQSADQANQVAKNATDIGNQNQNRLQELSAAVTNVDNYRMASEEEVMFRFNSANLTDEVKQKLDQIAQNASGMGRFVIEVQGFTDRSGPADYNLALSRRRADAVVRYLVDKQIPLRRIHMIGLGETTPTMAQMTGQGTMQSTAAPDPAAATPQTDSGTRRMTAKEMRRVIVRVWAPETAMSASTGAPQGSQSPGSTATPR
jgi:outer membrane protein OmpA-like peptidoglycan-associated protein